MNSLKELYIEELRDLYDAENQLLKALPKMAKASSSEELKEAFQSHFEETQMHVNRLEQIFEGLEEDPKGKTCKAMKGLIEEGQEVLKIKSGNKHVIDAALTAAAQRVEHYEIAGYGCVRTFAHLLGFEDAATLLRSTLDEEADADKKLTQIAEETINMQAAENENEKEEVEVK